MILNAIRTLTIKVTTQGAAEATQGLKNVAEGQKAVAIESDKATKATLSTEKAVERLQRQLDQTYRSQQRFTETVKTLDRGLSQGVISQSRYNQLLELTSRQSGQTAQSTSLFGTALAGVTARAAVAGGSIGAVGTTLAALGPVGIAVGAVLAVMTLGFSKAAEAALALADRAGNLRDFAETTGFTVTQLQALQKAGSQVGVSSESINKGLERFSVAMDEARRGTGQLFETMQRIDPVLAEQLASTNSLAEAWDVLAEATRKAGLEQRNVLARQTFGRGGVELTRLLSATAGAGGLSSMISQMQKLDLITQEQAEHWDDLGDSIRENFRQAGQNIASIFTGPVLEAVNKISEGITSLSRLAQEIATAFSNGINAVSTFFSAIWAWLQRIIPGLSTLAGWISQIRGLMGGGDEPLRITVGGQQQGVEADSRAATEALARQVKAYRDYIAVLGDAATPAEKLRLQIAELNLKAKEQPQFADAAARSIENLNKQFALDNAKRAVAALGDAATETEKFNVAASALKQQLDRQEISQETYNRALEELRNNLDPGGASQDNFNNKLEKTPDRLKEATTAAEDFTNALVQGMGEGLSATDAMIKAVDQMAEKLTTAGIKNLFSGEIALGGAQIAFAGLLEFVTAGARADKAAELTTKAINKMNEELLELSNTINDVVIGSIQSQAQAFTEQAQSIAEEAQQAAQQAEEASQGFFENIFDALFGDDEPAIDVTAQSQFQQTLEDINQFIAEASAEFRARFVTTVKSLTAGLGFSAVASEIEQFGDRLREFIADTNTAFGGDTAAMNQAITASTEMALSFISGAEAMTETEKEMLRITESAEAVRQVLLDMGHSAEAVAAAIDQHVIEALDRLTQKLTDDMAREINELVGGGWVNEFSDAIATMNEAIAGGVDPSTVSTWFALQVQQIIDGAQLTGEAFQHIVDSMPELIGLIHEFAEAVEDTADAVGEANRQLEREINEMVGGGWINEILDAVDRFTEGMAQGLDPNLLNDWLALTAQAIIDAGELTGAAFKALLGVVPQVASQLHEFAEVLDEVEDAADAARQATERMNLQLRLLRATTDASTLSGALAIQAMEQFIEMQEAIAAGSANLALLEVVHQAERQQVINEFHQRELEALQRAQEERERERERQLEEERRAADERARILEEAQETLDRFSRSIVAFIANLRGGSQSPLSPAARLASAQQSFQQQLAIITSGSAAERRAAMDSITSFAQNVIDAGFGMFGSATAGQSIFENVISTLEALPSQISVQELILEAIENQTDVIGDQTDVIGNQPPIISTPIISAIQLMRDQLIAVLNTGQLEDIAATLLTWLPQIDADQSGGISFQEMQQALGSSFSSGTLRGIFDNLDGNGNGILEKSELIKTATQGTKNDTTEMATQLLALAQISSNTAATANQVANGNGFLATIAARLLNIQDYTIRIRNNMTEQNLNWPNGYANINKAIPIYHEGGLVGGSGESTLAMVQPGEFIMSRNATRSMGVASMEAMNASANDNSLLGEIRALRGEVAALRSVVWQAGLHVGGRVDEASAHNATGQRKLVNETRQQSNRPREHGSRNKVA